MEKHSKSVPLIYTPGESKVKLAPAAQAILIQCLASAMVVLSVLIANHFAITDFPFFILVLMQSFFATALCIITGMAIWWRWIHFFFPLAMFTMLKWALPNEFYLIGFLMTLGMFWTTFRSQVPFFPSRSVVWRKVTALVPETKPVRMIDIGSGLGDLSMYIADARKQSQVEGIEVAPLPWMISHARAKVKRSPAKFTLGDYHELDFAQYDLVFAYLSPAAMPALWQKAQQQMKANSLLVSYEFEIPGVPPTETIDCGAKAPKLFVWKM